MKIPRYLRPVGAGPVPALAPSENNKISNHRSPITNSGSSVAQSICYFRSVICDLLFSETLHKGAHRWRPSRAFSSARRRAAGSRQNLLDDFAVEAFGGFELPFGLLRPV